MVIAEMVSFVVIGVVGIFDALRTTTLDGISLLIIFISIIFFEMVIDFIFDLLGTNKGGGGGNSPTHGTTGGGDVEYSEGDGSY